MSDAVWTAFFLLCGQAVNMVGSVLLQWIRARYKVQTVTNGNDHHDPAPARVPMPPR